jgi:hypothetical protein
MVMIIRFYLQLLKIREESSKTYHLDVELNSQKLDQFKVLAKNHALLMIKIGKLTLKIRVIFTSFSKLNIAFYSFFCIVRTLNNKILTIK